MPKKRQSRPRSPVQQAVEIARRTSILPTAMNAEQTANLTATLQRRVFWSARTTQAEYLKGLQKLVERHIRGEGYDNDPGQLRIEARKLLDSYGYTPEKGFPGDAKRGIPSAMPGTLRDLRSEIRLNLILDTQAALARGLGQKLRGLSRISVAPAWELVRVQSRTAPRDWEERWLVAGGSVKWKGVYNTEDARLIARKNSPIWQALGSRELFDDALNVDHAPFALQSGMGLAEMLRSDLTGLRLVNDRRKQPGQDSQPGQEDQPGQDSQPGQPGQEDSEEIPTEEQAISDMPEVQDTPEQEEPPEYVKPSDFIGGQKTIDKLLAKLAAWRAQQ